MAVPSLSLRRDPKPNLTHERFRVLQNLFAKYPEKERGVGEPQLQPRRGVQACEQHGSQVGALEISGRAGGRPHLSRPRPAEACGPHSPAASAALSPLPPPGPVPASGRTRPRRPSRELRGSADSPGLAAARPLSSPRRSRAAPGVGRGARGVRSNGPAAGRRARGGGAARSGAAGLAPAAARGTPFLGVAARRGGRGRWRRGEVRG